MIYLQEEDFNVDSALQRLHGGDTRVGAVAAFVGLVREWNGDRGIVEMTLEHYPGMTEKSLADVELRARDRWELNNALIIHRVGRLQPADKIVLVACSSCHRRTALDACAYMIDCLKHQIMLWKKEKTADGGEYWVQPDREDRTAQEQWRQRIL